MTTRPPDDSSAPLHDAAFDAAWREASSDTPPPALDAAILAAARRAVAAGPRRMPEATRPGRWWWPLAAAATIGAIAIGILQLGAPDKNGASSAETAVVTDMPGAPAPMPKTGVAPVPGHEPQAKSDGDTDAAAAAKDARGSAASERRAPTSASVLRTPAPVTPAPPALAPPAPAPAASALPGKTPAAAAPAATPAPVATPKAISPQSSSPGIGAVAPSPAAQPFPAGAVERRQRPAAETRSAMPGLLEKPDADAAVDATRASRAQQAPLPVAEWLALIRKLRAEGRLDEAARELAAFRLAHPDEARRLPDDLRDWQPPDAMTR